MHNGSVCNIFSEEIFMKYDPVNFSIFELIYEEKHPSIDDLINVLEDNFIYEIDDNFVYSVETEIVDGYYWLSMKYGAAHPRPSHIIDRSKGNALVENKRTESQVEPSSQLFCVYNPNTGNIYVSNSRKRMFLEELFNHYGEHKFWVKRVIVDPEEFLMTLRTVDKMAVAAKTDLLTHAGNLLQPVKDIFGYDAPEQFFISADFGVPLSERIIKQFRFFNSECKEGKIKKFICVGKNEHGLETVFNTDNFTQKIVASVKKQENGLYDTNEVRDEIISKLDKFMEEAA